MQENDPIRFVDAPSVPPFLRGRYGVLLGWWYSEHVIYGVRVLGQRLVIETRTGRDAFEALEPDAAARLVYFTQDEDRLDTLGPEQREYDLRLEWAVENLRALLSMPGLSQEFWLCDSAEMVRQRYGKKLKTDAERVRVDVLWTEIEQCLKVITPPLREAVE